MLVSTSHHNFEATKSEVDKLKQAHIESTYSVPSRVTNVKPIALIIQ